MYTCKGDDYCIDYTTCFDWTAGDYGDDGSCFTSRGGCRRGALCIIRDNGGYAIRFYKGGEGSGRAWVVPYNDSWVLFNAYGIDLSVCAQIVAQKSASHTSTFAYAIMVANRATFG